MGDHRSSGSPKRTPVTQSIGGFKLRDADLMQRTLDGLTELGAWGHGTDVPARHLRCRDDVRPGIGDNQTEGEAR